ncbi:MAG: MFS transporter [Armatimonadota bacterium]|nr:MFS transporter [Armatimonadota bacterium]
MWRHGDFMRLWVAQTISVFGSGFTQLALPLIAATTLQATPAQMGILGAAEFAPFLLVGLVAGVWVDRVRRRPVLVAGDVARAALLLTIPAAAVAGALGMGQLYVVGFLVGVCTVFFDVAYQAYLPSLVDRRQLVEGNSKLEATRSLAQIASPGIAGVVIEVLTAPFALVLDALSYLVSGGLLARIRRPEDPPDPANRRPVLTEIREGLAVVVGHRLLRAIAATTGTSNFFSSAVGALFILYATRVLGLSPATLGLIFGVGNTGGLVGATLAGRLARRFGVGPTIVGSAALFGAYFLPLLVATPATAAPLLVAGGFVGSAGGLIYNVNQVSLRQAIVPQRLQGRLNATMRFLVWGTIPLGSLVGGALGEGLGLRAAVLVGVLGSLTPFLWVLGSPVRTLRQVPEPDAGAEG